MVHLRIRSTGMVNGEKRIIRTSCGGTLLTTKVILTAGHCCRGRMSEKDLESGSATESESEDESEG